jgi:hypothetical protein
VCFVDSWVSASRRGISIEAVHFRPCSLEIRGLQRFAAVLSIVSVRFRACALQIRGSQPVTTGLSIEVVHFWACAFQIRASQRIAAIFYRLRRFISRRVVLRRFVGYSDSRRYYRLCRFVLGRALQIGGSQPVTTGLSIEGDHFWAVSQGPQKTRFLLLIQGNHSLHSY